MNVLFATIFVVLLVVFWALNLVGLPGNWLILLAAVCYAALIPAEARSDLSWPLVGLLCALAVTGELIEFATAALGASKVGGSKRSAVLALLGSLGGSILGLFVGLPIPIIGPLVGVLVLASLGAMAGALVGESWKGRSLAESWKVGEAAFWGRLFGTLGKLMIGAVMVALAVAALFV